MHSLSVFSLHPAPKRSHPVVEAKKPNVYCKISEGGRKFAHSGRLLSSSELLDAISDWRLFLNGVATSSVETSPDNGFFISPDIAKNGYKALEMQEL